MSRAPDAADAPEAPGGPGAPGPPRGRFARAVRAAEALFWAAQAVEARAWTRAFDRLGPRPPLAGRRPVVAVLVDGPPEGEVSPSSRFRALALAPGLARRGLEVRLLGSDPPKYARARPAPWPLGEARATLDLLRQERNRYRDLLRCAEADVVLAVRDLQDGAWSRLDGLLHLVHDRLVLDVDDALWTPRRDGEDPAAAARKWALLARGASLVVASTPHVAARARADGAPRVEVLPTAVDLDRYRPPASPAARAVPVVGWLGTSGNLGYLRRVAPALERAAAGRRFELRVMSDPVTDWPALAGAPSRHVPWTADGDVAFLQGLDVGLLPLDDTPWARGKAAFKAIQYLACGVPVVASPVGFNVDVVGTDGARGLLAGDLEAWAAAVGLLLDDPDLRRRQGAAGRAFVEARFGAEAAGERLAALLHEAAARPGFGGLRDRPPARRVLRWAPGLDLDEGPLRRAEAAATSLAGAPGDVEVVLAGPLRGDLPPREVRPGGLVVLRLGAPRAPYLRPDPVGRAAAALARRLAGAAGFTVEVDGDGPGAAAVRRVVGRG